MKEELFDKRFRIIATVLLALVIVTIPVLSLITKVSFDNYYNMVSELGSDAEELQDIEPFEMSMGIYIYNCGLLVVSLFAQAIYFISKWRRDWDKSTFKEKMAKNWPCILLAIFMCWTLVGCIQAGMEMDAEVMIKRSNSIDEVPERIIEIANWSSGDRMANLSDMYQNAKDRAWHGCNNLKDGYYSFMFYASVLLNVLMLGNNAKNHKKWLLRSFIITSLIMGFMCILSFMTPNSFAGVLYYNRLTFNNSNHFGYYISVVLMLSVLAMMLDDNWYFKGISLINCLFYFPLLILNNTFGAYLGILAGMIFVGVTALIRLISKHKVSEFVFYAIALLMMIVSSNVIADRDSNSYSRMGAYFTYSKLDLNFFGKNTIEYTFNSLSEENAKLFSIDKSTVGNVPVKWGNQVTELDHRVEPMVKRNFEVMFRDIGIILGFYQKANSEKVMTQEEFTAKVLEITAKYPKVSGETFEEYSARQDLIEKETQEFIKANNLLDESGNLKDLPSASNANQTNNKSGLDDEVSSTGSGRGEVWIRSLDLMNQRPLFGWGLENLLNEFVNQYGINEGRTHNLILQLGGTTGIVGMLIYITAVISIFLKVVYDAKLRTFDKKGTIIIAGVFLIATIILNVIVSKFTNKLLINGIATVLMWAVLYALIFIKRIKLRVREWNAFEYIGSGVFVSYMVSSFFGNSAFYTSPYFMIFLGLLVYEMLNKTPVFEKEKGAEDK